MDLLDRFREAIKIKTDWPTGAAGGDAAVVGEAEKSLVRFQEFLVERYPNFHKVTERYVLSPYSVVYRWAGSQEGNLRGSAARLGAQGGGKPALIMGHYDVVPAETEKWTTEPFGAELKDGYIYGRGTLDMKSILIAVMEGAETLIARGFQPKEDIWFAFGGDEERAGVGGAQNAAAWFAEKNIRFSFVLDEGTPIGVDQIPGVKEPIALFGIEEKGFLSLNLTVRQNPGHASQPPEVQATAILARALIRLSKNPFPFHLTPTVESFFTHLAPLASQGQGWAMKHARLLGRLFFKIAAKSPAIAAMLRTTVAMTQLEGSAADNVLPSTVKAVLNLRLLPPCTVEEAMAVIRRTIADDRVNVGIYNLATEAVAANPEHARFGGPGWREMAAALEEAEPGIPVLPFIMTATTDSRHFKALTEGIFRFNPIKLSPQDLRGIHGHDERISVENLNLAVRFYTALFSRL
ncbi:MAG: M20/M25/M40 family metallo-hydrolase [Treponema sp.]|jgi:carboxypeptidase PM20D1|nr:M20/M25/M40 family metallo-hydrolase [Treponema sp.]